MSEIIVKGDSNNTNILYNSEDSSIIESQKSNNSNNSIVLFENDFAYASRLPDNNGAYYGLVIGGLSILDINNTSYIAAPLVESSHIGFFQKTINVNTRYDNPNSEKNILNFKDNDYWPFDLGNFDKQFVPYNSITINDINYLSGVVFKSNNGNFDFESFSNGSVVPFNNVLLKTSNLEKPELLHEFSDGEKLLDYRMFYVNNYLYRIGNFIPSVKNPDGGALRFKYDLNSGETIKLPNIPSLFYTISCYVPSFNKWLAWDFGGNFYLLDIEGTDFTKLNTNLGDEHPGPDVAGYKYVNSENGADYFLNGGFAGSIGVFKVTKDSFVRDDNSPSLAQKIRDYALSVGEKYKPDKYISNSVFGPNNPNVWAGPNGDWTGYPVSGQTTKDGKSHWLFSNGIYVEIDISKIKNE